MSTAIVGTGGLGSVIARRLVSGGETLRLSSADTDSARTLAAAIGRGAAAASDNRDALQGADAVILALRFGVLKGVIEEIADSLTNKLVVVPSNPVGLDAQGKIVRLLPQRQSSGNVVAGWLPEGARPAMAFGSMSGDLLESSSNRSPQLAVLFYATDDERAGWQVERLIRTAGFEPVKVGGVEQSGRLEVGGDLHDLVVGPAEARSLIGGTYRLAAIAGRLRGRGAGRCFAFFTQAHRDERFGDGSIAPIRSGHWGVHDRVRSGSERGADLGLARTTGAARQGSALLARSG